MAAINGGEPVVRTLRKAGVEQVFALHGARIETLFQGGHELGLAILDTRHEVAVDVAPIPPEVELLMSRQ